MAILWTHFGTWCCAQLPKKNIVLIAGLKSHGPEGNGIHDYGWSARLIQTMLENSNVADQVNVTTFLNGWPSDPQAFVSANTIMIISDGRDGDTGREAPHLATDERTEQLEKLVERGCGVVVFHFATFAADRHAEKALDWYGGYFDWQHDGQRQWYSDITTKEARVRPAHPNHAVLRGVRDFTIKEEFYYDIRFRPDDPDWIPIWTVDSLPATRPHGRVVAWAVERDSGHRGFATTCGHFYANWQNPQFRKTMLNGLAWTAHVKIPAAGIDAPFFTRQQISEHLNHPDALSNSSHQRADEAYAGAPYWYQPGHAVDPAAASGITTLPGFQVEQVYRVPEQFGSWTAITLDNQGRLICAAQHQPGLYRLTLPSDPDAAFDVGSNLEKLSGAATNMGWSHGLLYAFDSLYVTVSEANDTTPGGLYRLQDTDDDDTLDQVDHILDLKTAGEHGPHNVVVGPDDQSLYMMCGNGTEVPDGISRWRPSRTDGVDHLMPADFDSSHYTAGGFVLRFDPDGKNRELICSGLRNSFDLAFNASGDLFTFDSDMEWDLGTPWYRPTRICHLVSGGEFGWRGGAAKWPAYYEDSVPAVLNIGPASPTGVTFGYGAAFPPKYQQALFACDWTFASIHAVHLRQKGGSYTAEIEEFLGGNGLPVTDLVVGHDGAIYFLVGGRRLGSALYRVRYVGDDPVEQTGDGPTDRSASKLHQLRTTLAMLHGRVQSDAVPKAWRYLDHPDRSIRFAARVALESQPVTSWQDKVFQTRPGLKKSMGLLALARKADANQLLRIIDHLSIDRLGKFPTHHQLTVLRTLELALARSNNNSDHPIVRSQQQFLDSLRLSFADSDPRVQRELARLGCYLGDRSWVSILLSKMQADEGQRPVFQDNFMRNEKYGKAIRDILLAAPLVDRMHDAQMLLWIDSGWTQSQRAEYFQLINDAVQTTRGGHWYQEFWERIAEQAVDQVPAAWRDGLRQTVSARSANDNELPQPEGPGEQWTINELLDAVQQSFHDRDFQNGRKMFAAAKCVSCHRFNGQGSSTGPDLSSIGQRFTLRDLLDSTLHPSKAISDQYRVTMVVLNDGQALTGRVMSRNEQELQLATNLNRLSRTKSIPLAAIESEKPTPVSTMPEDLLNPLNKFEVLDLLAYLVSGGDPRHPVFRQK